MLPNAYTIIGIIGHFISKEGKHCYIILRLREIVGKYTSENIAGVLINLFHDYKITGNIGYFIANNIESNNIYIKAIFCVLYLNISAKIYKERWLYYFSYITNFYAQAFIIKSNTEGVYKELAIVYYKMDFKKIEEL